MWEKSFAEEEEDGFALSLLSSSVVVVVVVGMRVVTVATTSLNQWQLDFIGNLRRTKKSLLDAKSKRAKYRIGPELELTGYGCEDAFLEHDTIEHAWEMVKELLTDEELHDIVIDTGLPVIHDGVRYNCRLFLLNGEVLFIRPKKALAGDGNYREPRWFTAWSKEKVLEQYELPKVVREIRGQKSCPIGDAYLKFENDVRIGCETCEELFTPNAPHIELALNGVEIISNGSGSHHQLRKLDQRVDLIESATKKSGGCYLYSNQRGCDGGRLYYDGCALISLNGEILKQGEQFSVEDVEVSVAKVDLDEIVSFRAAVASQQVEMAGKKEPKYPFVEVDFDLCDDDSNFSDMQLSRAIEVRYHEPEEEIARGPACWMWDYLRRSGASGFLLPLSGGADSSSTAAIVGSMCQIVCKAIEDETANDGNSMNEVEAECRRICKFTTDEAISPTKMANALFSTVYLGTDNSSEDTRKRAKDLAEEVGAKHLSCSIDGIVAAIVTFFAVVTGKTPKFKLFGGTNAENLAMQNIQARVRMILAFLFAQLLPWVRGQNGGFLLVLGSANVDEGLRGYLTKYDCSSADINPIGGISKVDLKKFLVWGATHLGYPTLAAIEQAPPTAELEPITKEYVQCDEVDMGMTYNELGTYGRLRKVARLGPVSMFRRLCGEWNTADPSGNREALKPREVAEKVKKFFFYYSVNRHKMTTITPTYHAENYSPDDNRFDLRPFLYNVKWPWQFARIDAIVAKAEAM